MTTTGFVGASDEPAPLVIGIDVGASKTNATVVDVAGHFLVDRMIEVPSGVSVGPDAALDAIDTVVRLVVEVTGLRRSAVRAVGLDTPGPASADGVLSSRGSTNFADAAWWGYDFPQAVKGRLGLPVVYSNDGNAAALYAHDVHFGPLAGERSSVAAIVGTGLGGGVIESGAVVRGGAGMAGEFGHIQIRLEGLLSDGQGLPTCNCGLVGDVESVASLTAIERNLLPYWLTQYPDHPLATVESMHEAARQVRDFAEQGDELALSILRQQAVAIGRLFTIASNFTDPDAYFVGGGVTDAAPTLASWFMDEVRSNTVLRVEQQRSAVVSLVPELDMAGARGAALIALDTLRLRGTRDCSLSGPAALSGVHAPDP